MLRDISLPAYAQASEISVRGDDGTLVEQQGRDQHDAPGAAEACEGEGPSIGDSGNGQLQFPRAAHYSF